MKRAVQDTMTDLVEKSIKRLLTARGRDRVLISNCQWIIRLLSLLVEPIGQSEIFYVFVLVAKSSNSCLIHTSLPTHYTSLPTHCTRRRTSLPPTLPNLFKSSNRQLDEIPQALFGDLRRISLTHLVRDQLDHCPSLPPRRD